MNESHETTAEVIEPTTAEVVQRIHDRDNAAQLQRVGAAGWSGNPGMLSVKEHFVRDHGGPALGFSNSSTTMYLKDGSRYYHNGIELVFESFINRAELDVLYDRYCWAKRLLALTDDAHFLWTNEKRREEMATNSISHRFGRLEWDTQLLGRQPLNDKGRFTIDTAIARLAFLVECRRGRMQRLQAEIKQKFPNLIIGTDSGNC